MQRGGPGRTRAQAYLRCSSIGLASPHSTVVNSLELRRVVTCSTTPLVTPPLWSLGRFSRNRNYSTDGEEYAAQTLHARPSTSLQYQQAIINYCEKKDLEKALALVRRMKDKRQPVSPEALAALLNCFSFEYSTTKTLAPQIESVLRDDKRQQKGQLEETRTLLTAKWRAYLRLRNLEGAYGVLKQMQRQRMQLYDRFLALLKAALERNDAGIVQKIDDDLRDDSSSELKYARLYPAMIQCYLSCGLPHKALEMYDRMKDEQVEIPLMVYPLWIQAAASIAATNREALSSVADENGPGYVMQEDSEEDKAERQRVMGIYEELMKEVNRQDKGSVNILGAGNASQLYDNLLTVCTTSSELALSIYEETKKHKVELGAIGYRLLVESLCKDEKDLNTALSLVQTMKLNGILPDYTSYNALIHALIRDDRMADVKSLLRQGDFPHDASFYHELITGLCEKGQSRECIAILDQMKRVNLHPFPITYTTLMHSAALTGDVGMTFAVWAAMKKEGVKSPTGLGHIYTILMKACEVAGDADRAFAVYREVVSLGKHALEGTIHLPAPFPLSFLDSLVRILQAAGRYEEARAFEEEKENQRSFGQERKAKLH